MIFYGNLLIGGKGNEEMSSNIFTINPVLCPYKLGSARDYWKWKDSLIKEDWTKEVQDYNGKITKLNKPTKDTDSDSGVDIWC